MNVLLMFYFGFWLTNQISAQIAKCYYKYQYSLTTVYKTTNASYYRCDLDTEQLNYNEKLTRIDGHHGTGHSDVDVKWIIPYQNHKLKTFSSIFCQKFPNLEVIDLSDAELESIDEDSLSNCQNLYKFILDGNKIREISKNMLTQNSKLTNFWISNNELETLPENLFINQRELEQLYLDDNQINVLPSNILRPLIKLEVLYLYNNKLKSINPEWFVNLQNLKWLSLRGNQISEIPSKCFAPLGNLEKLFIYENKIKSLKSDGFEGLENLQVLSLYSNEISDLPVGVFTQLTNLQELSLNNNKLTTIHSDSFGVHNHLTKVNLDENQIISIDEKFIDKSSILKLFMTNNICSQLDTYTRVEIKQNIRKCLDNYQPRQLQIESCSIQTKAQGTIIGGSEVKRGMYPWIAALIAPRNKYFCGGTLISKRKVATAAHCMVFLARDITVLLGVHRLKKKNEVGRFPYAVQSIHIHPNWNPNTDTYDADIAIMVLETEVTYSKYIQPICLMYANSTLATKMEGVVIGYGKDGDPKKEHSIIPKFINLPIHKNEDCFLKNYELARYSSTRTFCGGAGNGTSVCMGDSGSGLVVTDGSAYYLRGVVSASLNNMTYGCDVDTYSIFTNILHFTDWINELPVERVF